MIPIDEFTKENEEIIDLCDVLCVLVENHAFRSNSVVCDLMEKFITLIDNHISHEDRIIYGDLLAQHTPKADMLASHFLGNTQELKRICASYKKDWCRTVHSEEDHENYVKDSMDIFKLIRDRIDFETNKIFPIFQN